MGCIVLNLIYIHGFLSSSLSHKAQSTQRWLAQHHPDINYTCPELSAYPHEAKHQLMALCGDVESRHTCVIGSSLGGFWATYLIENALAAKAVLVNPAVHPHKRFTALINTPLKSYYSDKEYMLTEKDLIDLEDCSVAQPKNMSSYWLLAQTGDETLDYRHAVAYYKGAKQTIEQGGNHSFAGFDDFLPDILRFFEP